MDNSEIARKFDLLAKIMELHDENFFKIKSYTQAYGILRKVEKPFATMTKAELEKIPGVGGAIADKIIELTQTGEMKTLNQFIGKTPAGIVEMLHIRGLGPKKIKQIWKELDIETTGELLYACNENRIAHLKGFGQKTQDELIQILQYAESQKGKTLYAQAQKEGLKLIQAFAEMFPGELADLVGEISLQWPVVRGIELITTVLPEKLTDQIPDLIYENNRWVYRNIPVYISMADSKYYAYEKFRLTCAENFFEALMLQKDVFKNEAEIFSSLAVPTIHPARRDDTYFLDTSKDFHAPVETTDINGLIHFHTHYSDGLNSLQEMQDFATKEGFEYMVVTDHSQSAFYANGLKEERLLEQWKEIDLLNSSGGGCYILKGIESDILIDGELDYSADVLKQFDCIVASVHSVLKMDVEKATARLIKAIENPATKILGHPTGRLLLSRQGYPLHMTKVLDACLANGVAIELNANPRRLDVDFTYLPLIAEKGVLLSINPDAHSKEAIRHLDYGVRIAQKANLDPRNIVNTWSLEQMKQWLEIQ